MKYLPKHTIKTVFELGSRDLKDAQQLLKHFPHCNTIYSFECNPDCLKECEKVMKHFTNHEKQHIQLISKAVSTHNGNVTFFPFDTNKYNNIGASSMYKIDFTKRNKSDPDYGRENPQKEVLVPSVRLDTFMSEKKLNSVDLICMDLQGYELEALKGLGEKLHHVKYVITECCVQSTYNGGVSFRDLENYLTKFGFKYVCSNAYGSQRPPLHASGFSEFDSLFIRQ